MAAPKPPLPQPIKRPRKQPLNCDAVANQRFPVTRRTELPNPQQLESPKSESIGEMSYANTYGRTWPIKLFPPPDGSPAKGLYDFLCRLPNYCQKDFSR